MASKIDGILRQSMDIYGAVKPIAQEAAQNVRGLQSQAGAHQYGQGGVTSCPALSGRTRPTKGGALVERLAGAIGEY